MSSENIRPSTMDGIKRLAKSIKTLRGLQHARALDESAKVAGFENYRHARNKLKVAAQPQLSPHARHRVYITVYWHDKQSGERGRETLILQLATLWSELIQPAQFQNHRAIVHFHRDGPDHLAQHELSGSQSRARSSVCAVARTLQFMDATKLKPSKGYSRVYPDGRSSNAVPEHDHESVWYDPETKRYLYADEPYEASAEKAILERNAWAERHGITIIKPSWPGMYYSNGDTRLYLITDAQKGIPLGPIVAALERLPAPMNEDTWNGESAPSFPYFVSPGSIKNDATVKMPPQKLTRSVLGKRNTVGYVQTFVGLQRRPNGKMPVEMHARVGELLKSVLVASFQRKGVYSRVNDIRCELDEWTMREYNHDELPSEQFFGLYYHESAETNQRTISSEERLKHIASLESVKSLLIEYYPDSPPLRSVLKKVDEAVKSMHAWCA